MLGKWYVATACNNFAINAKNAWDSEKMNQTGRKNQHTEYTLLHMLGLAEFRMSVTFAHKLQKWFFAKTWESRSWQSIWNPSYSLEGTLWMRVLQCEIFELRTLYYVIKLRAYFDMPFMTCIFDEITLTCENQHNYFENRMFFTECITW